LNFTYEILDCDPNPDLWCLLFRENFMKKIRFCMYFILRKILFNEKWKPYCIWVGKGPKPCVFKHSLLLNMYSSPVMCTQFKFHSMYLAIKGTVLRESRWVLLYIYQSKVFSRDITDQYKILVLLKGHFPINKRRSSIWMAQQFHIV